MIHLDTHVVIWLYTEQTRRIPRRGQEAIEVGPVAVSPMVELELAYLAEIGRFADRPETVFTTLRTWLELQVSTAPFTAVVREATRLTWSRDPFDRIIAAQAVVDGAALLTADTGMLEHLPSARWE